MNLAKLTPRPASQSKKHSHAVCRRCNFERNLSRISGDMSNVEKMRRPTRVQTELMRTGSFHLGDGRNHMESFSAKLSKSDKDSANHVQYLTDKVQSILFTDLMRAATDKKFTAKLESIKHLHEKIRKSQGDTDAELDENMSTLHCGMVLRERLASKINNSTLLMAAVRANNARAVYLFAKCMNEYDNLRGIGVAGEKRSEERRSIELQNTLGNTAVLLAGEYGYPVIIETLARAGADLTHVNVYKGTLLHLAVEGNHLRAVQKILELVPEYISINENLVAVKDAPREGPKSAFWLKKEIEKVPVLVRTPFQEVHQDMVTPLSRVSKKSERESTRQAFMQGELRFPMRGDRIKGRRVVNDDFGIATYEYLPIFDEYTLEERDESGREMKQGSGVWWQKCVVKKLEKKEDEVEVPAKSHKATWHTATEMRTWQEDASDIQNTVDKFSTKKLNQMRVSAIKGEEKVDAVIGRRSVGEREEYLVSWVNTEVICTWNTRTSISSWTSANGEKLVDEYDNRADQLIRLFLNQRNAYGKSSFISACEFGKSKIAIYMANERWNCKASEDKYMRFKLSESRNMAGITCLHYAVKTSKPELVRMLVEVADESGEYIKSATLWGDTPLLWLSEVITSESVEIARFLLQTLRDTTPSTSSTDVATRTLNGVTEKTTAEMPNALTNPLMRAAKAGNMDMVKVFLEFGAEKYADGGEFASEATFKNAATFAYEAKFFDVAFELDPEGTSVRLQEEFTRRCETTSHIQYMQDFNLLTEMCGSDDLAKTGIGSGAFAIESTELDTERLATKMLPGLLADAPRFHNFFGTRANVYGVEAHKPDLIALTPCQERALCIFSPPMCELDVDNEMHPSRTISKAFGKDEGVTKIAKEQLIELNLLTEQNKLFLSTPPGQPLGAERTLLVKLIEDKPIVDVRQMAFDHYMSRIELFSRIARLSVARTDTFESFSSIIRTSRIYNCGAFCDTVMKAFYEGLRDVTGQDEFILYKIMIMMDTLAASRNLNPSSDAHYYNNHIEILDGLITNLFSVRKMGVAKNVKRVITPNRMVMKYQNSIVDLAFAYHNPIFDAALKLEVTSFFGLPQISAVTDEILHANLMSPLLPSDPELRNIFNIRDSLEKQIFHRYTSGYERIRYCPIVLFWLEAMSKTIFLGLISYVAVFDYGELTDPEKESNMDELEYTNRDLLIVVFLLSTMLREGGEYEGTTLNGAAVTASVANSSSLGERMVKGVYDHFFNNIWNFLDLCSIILVGGWAVMKSMDDYKLYARGFLTSAAMPMALSLLRYAAIEKEMGNLVITLVSMSRDFYSFLVVYLVSIFGFGVALRGLFQHDYVYQGEDESVYFGFSTFTGSFLTLVDATMGQHDFAQLYRSNEYLYLGLVIEVVFLLLTMVILFNLLIAKMSSTYAKSEDNALQEWEYSKATIVEQFVLAGEASPLCALPAPFNLITCLVYWPHHFIINKKMFGVWFRGSYTPPKNIDSHEKRVLSHKDVLSLGGTVADYVLAFISAPIIGFIEILSDIFSITVDVWRHHEDFMKKYARDKKTGDLKEATLIDPATMATLQLFGYALLHIALICLVSPLCLIFYSFQTVQTTIRNPVRLQLYSEDGSLLQIVYPKTDTARYEPRPVIKKQNFTGNFIRGALSREGEPYEDRSTFVRCTAGPYSSSTPKATCKVTRQLNWKASGDLPKNTKDLVSMPKSSSSPNHVELPLFPFSDDELLTHLLIEIVEVHSAGEITVASSHIHGKQLHRWALDGRFEGKLFLLNHTGVPDHVMGYTKEENYPERVIILPSVLGGKVMEPEKFTSSEWKDKMPTCEIRRKGSDLSDPLITLRKGSTVASPTLVTAIVFDPNISSELNHNASEKPPSTNTNSSSGKLEYDDMLDVDSGGSIIYHKNDKFRTFHVYYHGHFTRKGKTLDDVKNEAKESRKGRRFKRVTEINGKPVLYISADQTDSSKNEKEVEEIIKKDLETIKCLDPELHSRLGLSRKGAHGFDTVDMSSFKCSIVAGPEIEGKTHYQPVISTSASHDAYLQVAFAFDLDLSDDLRQAAEALSAIPTDIVGMTMEDSDKQRTKFVFGTRHQAQISPETAADKSLDESATDIDESVVFKGHPRFNKEWSQHMAVLDLIDAEEREGMFSFLHDTVDGSDLVQKLDSVRDEITENTKNLLDDIEKQKAELHRNTRI